MIKKLLKWYFKSFEDRLESLEYDVDLLQKEVYDLEKTLPESYKFIDKTIEQINKRQLRKKWIVGRLN